MTAVIRTSAVFERAVWIQNCLATTWESRASRVCAAAWHPIIAAGHALLHQAYTLLARSRDFRHLPSNNLS
jgi:hypothetical protein